MRLCVRWTSASWVGSRQLVCVVRKIMCRHRGMLIVEYISWHSHRTSSTTNIRLVGGVSLLINPFASIGNTDSCNRIKSQYTETSYTQRLLPLSQDKSCHYSQQFTSAKYLDYIYHCCCGLHVGPTGQWSSIMLELTFSFSFHQFHRERAHFCFIFSCSCWLNWNIAM